MNRVEIAAGLPRVTLGHALVLMFAGVVVAGAPAPPPTTATGPHQPQHQVANLGDLRFENGAVVKDFKVSYVTHGTLNKQKDNVILVMQFFTGDHHGLDFLIGAGKALDPTKYFIVATDFVGNSILRQDVTTGPTNSGLKMEFPKVTAERRAELQHIEEALKGKTPENAAA